MIRYVGRQMLSRVAYLYQVVLLASPPTVVDILVGHGSYARDYSHYIPEANADHKHDPDDLGKALLLMLLCERILEIRGRVDASVSSWNLWRLKPSLLQEQELAVIADAMIHNIDAKRILVLLNTIELADISSTNTLKDLVRIIEVLDFDDVDSR